MSLRVPLTLACWDYDRTLPLAQGDVRPAGVDLTYLSLPVEETFFRMLRYREFEAAELSLSSYVLSLAWRWRRAVRGHPGVPVPGVPAQRHLRPRRPRHHRARGPGRAPWSGVPEYQLTAAVWIRGILAERHGLPVASVRYRTGGLHAARPDRQGHARRAARGGDRADPGRPRRWPGCSPTGGIDALYTPRTPRPFAAGDPRVARLFPDPRAAEEQYYADDRDLPDHARGRAAPRRVPSAGPGWPGPSTRRSRRPGR